MKTLLYYCLLSMLSINGYSQNSDVYILINNKSVIDTITVRNDSIFYQKFEIKNKACFGYIEYKVTQDKKLEKTIRMKGEKGDGALRLIYENLNNDNPPNVVQTNNLENIITYNDIVKSKDFKNLISILKLFDNIFLINEDAKYDDFYISKKVSIKPILSGL